MKEKDRLSFQIPSASKLILTLFEYAWAILVVLNGNTVYHASAVVDYWLLELCVIVTWVLLGVEVFFRRIRPRRSWAVMAVALAVYCVVYLTVRQTAIAVVDFTCLFVVGLPGLVMLFAILHTSGALKQLFRKVFNVIVVLAALSVYYWLFGVMFRIIQPNSRMLISWGTVRNVPGFDGLHFVTQLDTTFFPDLYIYRNSGIFTEAPMFNLWLDMALAGELFLASRISKFRVMVLVIAILTTLSTTGILFLGLCLVIHILRNYRYMDRTQRTLLLLGGSILLPVLGAVSIYTMVLKSDTQSYLMRLSDYVAGVRLWWDYPIFGSGYGDLKSLQQYMYSPDGILGFSNSLTAVLGTGGLWIAMLFYIPHFSLLSKKVSGDRDLSCFALCYVYLFCTTAFFGRYIAVVMIAFGLVILMGRAKKI